MLGEMIGSPPTLAAKPFLVNGVPGNFGVLHGSRKLSWRVALAHLLSGRATARFAPAGKLSSVFPDCGLATATSYAPGADQLCVFVDGTTGAMTYSRHGAHSHPIIDSIQEKSKFLRPRPPFLPQVERSARCFATVVLPPAAPIHLGHTSFVLV